MEQIKQKQKADELWVWSKSSSVRGSCWLYWGQDLWNKL